MTVPAPALRRWYCPSGTPSSWSIRSRCHSRSGDDGSPQRSRREAVWVESRATSTSRQRVEMTSCASIAGAMASTRSATASERSGITGFFWTSWTTASRLRQMTADGKEKFSERVTSDEGRVMSRLHSSLITHHSSLLVLAALSVALALRLLNLHYAFDHGKPVLTPLDELYHWKRM